MRIKKIIKDNHDALPGYDLKGYIEVAVPVYKGIIEVTTVEKKELPVVQDFTLRLYAQGIELNGIATILGLDYEIIRNAFIELVRKNYIDFEGNGVTINGEEYLKDNSLDAFNKNEITIFIDILNKEITKNNNYMLKKVVLENGIKPIKYNCKKPCLDDLDFNKIKQIFKEYKSEDDLKYSGEILDVIGMKNGKIMFNIINVLIFENEFYEDRILCFDAYGKIDNYEDVLFELDKQGIKLLDEDFGSYFKSKFVQKVEDILSNVDKSINLIKHEESDFLIDRYLFDKTDEDEIIITVPLISKYNFKDTFIRDIEKSLDKNVLVTIILCGNNFVNDYQKRIIQKIMNLSNNNKKLNLIQLSTYMNPIILNKFNKKLLIMDYKKNDINLYKTNEGFTEVLYELKNENFDSIYSLIESEMNVRALVEQNKYFEKEEDLKKCILKIIELVRDANNYMFELDDIGWMGEKDIPHIDDLENIKLAKNKHKFNNFIDSLSKSLVESIENNTNAKQNKYFWNDFKANYRVLQKALNRIKIYRNNAHHLKLNENNQKAYIKFIKEDINGCMPEYINNGYLILQYKILIELKAAVEITIKRIKN